MVMEIQCKHPSLSLVLLMCYREGLATEDRHKTATKTEVTVPLNQGTHVTLTSYPRLVFWF